MNKNKPEEIGAEFKEGLERLINTHNIDAYTETPDYELMKELCKRIEEIKAARKTKDKKWLCSSYCMGRKDHPCTPEKKEEDKLNG